MERDGLLRGALYETLREAGYRLLPIRDGAHAKELLDGMHEAFAAAVIDDESWPMTESTEAWLRGRWPCLPILVLADDTASTVPRHVHAMHLADLLIKPFELALFVQRVGRLVKRGRRSARVAGPGPRRLPS